MRSYRSFNRALPSSSKSSSFPYKESMAHAMFLVYEKRNSIIDCGELFQYNLEEVYRHYLGHPFKCRHKGNHKDSALACSEVLQHCASASSSGFIFKYDIETATPCLAEASLEPLCASFDQKPDVSVSRVGEITSVSLVEIHSSPYEDTIRKAIVTGLDLLRLRRTHSSDTTALTTFAFPNLKVKQCVVKVQLRWENFSFKCYLTPINTVEEIAEHLSRTFNSFPSLLSTHHSPGQEKFVMHLSAMELGFFGEGSSQEPAKNSIIVRNKTWVYKKPFWYEDESRLQNMSSRLEICKAKRSGCTSKHYAIELENTLLSGSQFFRYQNVPHNPMSDTEVKKCLREFYSRVHTALENVHKELKLAHMDIRLNNICFNDRFQPILIDFDRSLPTTMSMIPLTYGKSCMYPEWVEQLEKADWVQFGWVIAWVLCDEWYEYHSATFERLPLHLQESGTLKNLIQEGTCRV